MIPENLLKGELFQYNGKPEVYWHIPNPEAFAKYVARTDLIEFRAEPTVEKIVEKPVDRPETLAELKIARESLSVATTALSDAEDELNVLRVATKNAETSLTTCETVKDDLFKQKADWLKEMDNIYKKNYVIPRIQVQKLNNLLTKLYNIIKLRKGQK